MATRTERIEALKQKAAQARAQVQKLEALEAKSERRQNERKKYVLGAAVVAAIQKGVIEESAMLALVDQFNKRNNDRALFGLPSLPEPAKVQA